MKKGLPPAAFLLAMTLAQATWLAAQVLPDQVLLKDYKPKSIFKIPETHPVKAK